MLRSIFNQNRLDHTTNSLPFVCYLIFIFAFILSLTLLLFDIIVSALFICISNHVDHWILRRFQNYYLSSYAYVNQNQFLTHITRNVAIFLFFSFSSYANVIALFVAFLADCFLKNTNNFIFTFYFRSSKNSRNSEY